ncbi:ATP-binding protein [Streptomyces alfalfae]|uniref:ATP-binding protein n=1 Tax=Streptomyces alfalfae TaxID=1642299 RepID=A0A7T4U067_9ACTN|nr:ATP-binding protein [Streptomyces alfalfae]QQC92025.1 ATP-binding protein [Streptomyces alfalfae]
MFTQCFSSTPRGARLARRLVAHRMDTWGYPYTGEVNETLALITAELAANAARYGRTVPARDFRVHLAEAVDGTVRVEVTDTRAERLPVVAGVVDPEAERGRGLLLVEALACRWGVMPRPDGPGKTVWAELRVTGPSG